MRLIDADELPKKEIKDEKEDINPSYAREWNDATRTIYLYAPTIEAAPVRRGKWTQWYHREDDFSINCSLCFRPVVWPSPYCPNCGAKMEVQE